MTQQLILAKVKIVKFTEVTVEEVEGLVRKAKVTSCVLDPISSSIVKRHIKGMSSTGN